VVQALNQIAIAYRAERRALWRYYWWAWRRGLWKFHALSVVIPSFIFVTVGGFAFRLSEIADGLLCSAAVIVVSILWPQLRFKSAMRTLTVDASGIKTGIGKIEKTVPWVTIAEASAADGSVYLVRQNKNAFVIPTNAFQSAQERDQFLSIVKRWREDAR
jgi:hypothetical protein